MVTFSPLKSALDVASAILTSVNLARSQLSVSFSSGSIAVSLLSTFSTSYSNVCMYVKCGDF
jgi:hypothetical protein